MLGSGGGRGAIPNRHLTAAAARGAPDVINVSRGILYAGDDRTFAARAKDWADKIAAAFPAL